MNWRCRLGLHYWEKVDTTEAWKEYCRKQGKKGIVGRLTLAKGNRILLDEFCVRCGKRNFEALEENKAVLLDKKNYILIKGKIVEE